MTNSSTKVVDHLEPVTSIPLAISPNPSKGNYTVYLAAGAENTSGRLLITNVSGQTIVSRDIKVHQGENKIDMDIEAQVPGAYFVRIEIGGACGTGSLIKY